ncbi:MAG: HU family DNA-binding protein [Tannerella sp.]|nr:HU family DNA-binding protein [Tannerella sp.]
MNERFSTRSLADILAIQTGLDKERAEKFIDVLSSYIAQGIENNKSVKVMGFGIFKIVLVRERESVHIQTGERFVIPAHHKLSFIPDRDLKEQINRPFALFLEPIEAIEDLSSLGKQASDGNETEKEPETPMVILDDEITEDFPEQGADFSEVEETPVSGSEEPDEETGPASDHVDVVHYEYEEINTYPEDDEEEDDEDPVQVSGEQGKDENEEVGMIVPVILEVDEQGIDESEETEEYTLPEKTEEYNKPPVNDKKKKKMTPLWLWFLLLPFLILAGIALGTYAFLYFNSDKPYGVAVSLVGDNKADKALIDQATVPLPIGGSYVSDTDDIKADELENFDNQTDDLKLAQAGNENTTPVSPNNTIAEEATTKTTNKKEGKPVIDWLASPPENTDAKSEPKRVDKPNQAIEDKNKTLSGTKQNQQRSGNTASTTNRAKSASSEKVIPARVRMTAGSSLTQIALEHYGDIVFWVYIYDYNKSRIKDFNNIHVGTEIYLPQPNIYGINAKSKASVQKARQKQAALLKWYNWDDYQ